MKKSNFDTKAAVRQLDSIHDSLDALYESYALAYTIDGDEKVPLNIFHAVDVILTARDIIDTAQYLLEKK